MCDSRVVFRELGACPGDVVEVGEELKAGRIALGGARRVPQGGRLEEPPA